MGLLQIIEMKDACYNYCVCWNLSLIDGKNMNTGGREEPFPLGLRQA
jgi:hypothetical protein